MKEFIKYILQFGNLNQQQIELISKKAIELELPKGQYFLESGKIALQFGFIVEGIIRIWSYNEEGDATTKYFIEENNILVNLESFDNKIPATSSSQAVTDCRLIVFSKQDWDNLLKNIDGWENIVHRIISRGLLLKVSRISPLISIDATARYLSFIDRYPNLANRIPLSFVASYLGMTQSSLSRIRKNLR